MATETARIKLELASGKNAVTAPFHQTALVRRKPPEETPAEADTIVAVPSASGEALSTPPRAPETTMRPTAGRPTWIAFIGATVAVAAAVWWVMFQRLPDIDPRQVIERNLGDARSAMAEGRYTDPPGRSAFHYYSTVLALDPDNAAARRGIEDIADRHLTDAFVSLAERRVADAAVALEKARRVRPDHSDLPELDAHLRAELRKIIAAANTVAQPEPRQRKAAARTSAPSAPSIQPARPQKATVIPSAVTAPSKPATTSTASARTITKEPAPLALAPVETKQTSPSLITPIASEPAAPEAGQSGSAPVVDEPASPSPAPAPEAMVQTVAPKLVKMVQPEYPQEAVMRGIEGWVDVSLEVNAAGDVVAPRIEDSSRGRLFNRAALAAVRQWKYEPRTDGATSERIHVRLRFRHSK